MKQVPVTIAVDAMGGDYAPNEIVIGALQAARQGVSIILFGDKLLIEQVLMANDASWKSLAISVMHCNEVIDMAEEPTRAIARKYDASLVTAVRAVAQGCADALVSAGNSGAIHVASTLHIGRVPGVLRPAIGGFIPTITGRVFCIDLGANVDCKPEYLVQFAHMGHAYVRLVEGIACPRIGLISNGHEPYKGDKLVTAAYKKLEESQVNFIGNVEARDIFQGFADVLVCDGFVGNIVLKTAQGTARVIMDWIGREVRKKWWTSILFFLGKNVFSCVKGRMDYAKTGGALLLGINKPVIIAHGTSKAEAITHAILFACRVVSERQLEYFNATIKSIFNQNATTLRIRDAAPLEHQ